MGLVPDKQYCGLRMRRECRERFLHHRGLAIPTCMTHVRAARAAMHVGIANLRFPLKSVTGKIPAFPAFAQPAIFRICQEAHDMWVGWQATSGYSKVQGMSWRGHCDGCHFGILVSPSSHRKSFGELVLVWYMKRKCMLPDLLMGCSALTKWLDSSVTTRGLLGHPIEWLLI